jgi:hypothetical protein
MSVDRDHGQQSWDQPPFAAYTQPFVADRICVYVNTFRGFTRPLVSSGIYGLANAVDASEADAIAAELIAALDLQWQLPEVLEFDGRVLRKRAKKAGVGNSKLRLGGPAHMYFSLDSDYAEMNPGLPHIVASSGGTASSLTLGQFSPLPAPDGTHDEYAENTCFFNAKVKALAACNGKQLAVQYVENWFTDAQGYVRSSSAPLLRYGLNVHILMKVGPEEIAVVLDPDTGNDGHQDDGPIP